MRQERLFIVFALVFVLDAGLALGQDNAADEKGSDPNVSITLEDASRSRAEVADLVLPIEQESRPSPAPSGQERRFEPADFARPNRLESMQITASDLPRGTTTAAVRCQAFIARDGKLGEYHCIADDNTAYEQIVTTVIDAVPMQRFVAARVDGESVPVLMNFAVYVDCSSGSCLAVAARNHGYHIERLGLDYVDPQPIVEGDNWYEGFDYKLRWARAWMPSIRNLNSRNFNTKLDDWMSFVIAAEVDTSGIAAPACLYWVRRSMSGPPGAAATRAPSRSAPLLPWLTIVDIERAVASFGRVGYVPGMIDAAPATLRLFEQGVTEFEPESGGQYSVGDIACN